MGSIQMSDKEDFDIQVSDFVEDNLETSPIAKRRVDPTVAIKYAIDAQAVDDHILDSRDRARALRPYARRMFIDSYPCSTISRLLGLQLNTVKHWATQDKWVADRQAVMAEFHNAIMLQRLEKISRLSTAALDVITRAILKLKSKGDDVTIHEAHMVSSIFSNMDKVLRLASGQPTDIVENRGDGEKIRMPKNAKELKAILDADPFMIDVTPEKGEETSKEGQEPPNGESGS